MANGTSSLREKTIQVRRQHVLEAAVRVFAERGFHRSTIRDVALAAGVSDGAIYNVFANKQALLLGMLDPLGDAADVTPPAVDDLNGLLYGMLERGWGRYTPQVLPMLRVVLSEVLVDRELRELFVEQVIAPVLTKPLPIFESLAARGELDSSDVEMTLRVITGSFLGLLLLRLIGDEFLERRAEEVPGALAGILLNGMFPSATRVGTNAIR